MEPLARPYPILVILGLSILFPTILGSRFPRAADRCGQMLDVAIVGGGVGGTYSAYSLRQEGLTIGLFEYSDRIGGRLFTHDLAGSEAKVELGGMRYIDGAHVRLQKLIGELGLTPVVFREGFGRAGRTRFFLRNKSLTLDDISSGDVPYNLTPDEKANQGNLWEYYLYQLTGVQLNGDVLTREANMNLQVKDGRYLFQLTFDEALDMVASPEGKAFLVDTHVFHTETTGDASVSMTFDDHLGEDGDGGDVYTLAEGMQSVPRNLLAQFLAASNSHTASMNQQLVSIRSTYDGQYELMFAPTSSQDRYTTPTLSSPPMHVCAKKVILALPHMALLELEWPVLSDISAEYAFSAVRDNPVTKVFLTFDTTWWLNNTLREAYVTKSDEMFSQMYDWWSVKPSGPYTLLASYCDVDNSLKEKALWDIGPLMQGSEQGYGHVTQALVDVILDELALAYEIPRSSIPAPLTGTSQHWSDYPFGGGWMVWKAGYHIDSTQLLMRQPSPQEEVYVVGSDYSWGMMSAWIEGALETVDDVMDTFFQPTVAQR